jgi:hypothetical protein
MAGRAIKLGDYHGFCQDVDIDKAMVSCASELGHTHGPCQHVCADNAMASSVCDGESITERQKHQVSLPAVFTYIISKETKI